MAPITSGVGGSDTRCSLFGISQRRVALLFISNEEIWDMGVSGESPGVELFMICSSWRGTDPKRDLLMVSASPPDSETESVPSLLSSGSLICRGLVDTMGSKWLTGFLCVRRDTSGNSPGILQGLLLPLSCFGYEWGSWTTPGSDCSPESIPLEE